MTLTHNISKWRLVNYKEPYAGHQPPLGFPWHKHEMGKFANQNLCLNYERLLWKIPDPFIHYCQSLERETTYIFIPFQVFDCWQHHMFPLAISTFTNPMVYMGTTKHRLIHVLIWFKAWASFFYIRSILATSSLCRLSFWHVRSGTGSYCP